MDKAPDFGSGDCRFESCHGRLFFSCLDIFDIQCCLFLMNCLFSLFSFVVKSSAGQIDAGDKSMPG